jgi:hypothetical protein
MFTNQYIKKDNQLTVTINQVRNDGSLSFELLLQIDEDKHQRGGNLIDCIVLSDYNNLLSPMVLPNIA